MTIPSEMGNVQMSIRSWTARQCHSTTLIKQYRMITPLTIMCATVHQKLSQAT